MSQKTSNRQSTRRQTPRISNTKRIEKLYSFFNSAEKSGRRFTVNDICDEVGYTFGTANGYRSKKWFWFLYSDGPDTYFSKGLHQLPKAIFVGIHRQKWEEIIAFLLTQYRQMSQERRAKRATKPLPAIKPTPYNMLPNLVLLLFIMKWYRVSRKVRLRVWRVYLPV